MLGSWNRVAQLLAVVIVLNFAATARAVVTNDQRNQINEVGLLITKAGNLYKSEKHKEAAEAIKEAHGKLEKLATASNLKELLPMLNPIYDKLERAGGLLELEGYILPAVKRPEDKPAATPGAPAPGGAASFSKDVAPILISRCGNCHVRNARGMISMASYEALLKGKGTIEMVVAGNADASFLIGVIEDAKMPPSGVKLPANEIALLKKWINEGGKFDGKNVADNLNDLAPGTKVASAPPVALATATGKEKISYTRDIAPMFESSCAGCHGNGRRPEGNFDLVTFDRFLKGGDTGPAIVPGKPAESYLVKKLKGTASGARMPQRGKAWTTEMIAKVELWIQEGARFDGISPRSSLERIIAVYKAQTSTHEELSKYRIELAQKTWDLSSPGIKAARYESENFFVMGDLGDNTLKDLGERAEALVPKIAKIVQAPSGQPMIKGRFSLFIFKDRYGYSQLGEMVEKRSLPNELKGHWEFDIVDAYGAVLNPRMGGDYTAESVIAQNFAGAYIATLGKNTPRWFSEGVGRFVAAKVASGDPRVNGWNDQMNSVVAGMSKADDFLNNKMNPEARDIAAYGYITFLSGANSGRSLGKLLDDLRAGAEFDKAFVGAFGGTPQQGADAFAKRPPQIKGKAPTKTGKKT